MIDNRKLEKFYNATIAEKWAVVRSYRNAELSKTDWTQLPDAPLSPNDKTEYQIYRQALRDVPQLPVDISTYVIWDIFIDDNFPTELTI